MASVVAADAAAALARQGPAVNEGTCTEELGACRTDARSAAHPRYYLPERVVDRHVGKDDPKWIVMFAAC